MNKKIVLQIFTGGFNSKKLEFKDIENKLIYVLENIQVEKVIMGWSINLSLYNKTKELLNKYNVEYYLWIPVFSEVGILKESKLLVDYYGKEIESYALCEDENFEFYCPNNTINIENLIEVYDENFKEIGFDGVFLDKIRYGSFSNKLTGVLNCFCDECVKIYKDKDINTEYLKVEMEAISEGHKNYQKIPFNINGYKDGKYEFENQIWSEFFQVKSESIYSSMLKITDYFKSINVKIGIDTFSPFISYFAGQDLEKLQNICDFIKPMMYRVTKAPAGLPFESDNLVKESIKDNIENANKKYLELIGASNYDKEKYPIDFVLRELKYMTEKLDTPIYAGIEINRKEDIAPVYPDYIEENLIELKDSNIKGYVLSWDLLSAPKENIDEVIKHFKN